MESHSNLLVPLGYSFPETPSSSHLQPHGASLLCLWVLAAMPGFLLNKELCEAKGVLMPPPCDYLGSS